MTDPGSVRVRRGLLRYLVNGVPRSGYWLVAVISGLSVLAGLLPAAAAVLSQRTFDAIVDGTPVMAWFVIFLFATLVLTVIGAVIEYLEDVLGRSVQAQGMETLLDSVSGLPTLAEMEDPIFRDALMVAQDSGTVAPTEVFNALMATTRTTITVISMGALLIAFAPWSVVVIAVGIGPAAWMLWRRSHSEAALTWRLSKLRRRSDFYVQLLTDLQAAKEIRLFSTAGFFRSRMSQDLRAAIGEENRFGRRWTFLEISSEVFAALTTGAVSVVFVSRTAQGDLTVGDLTMLLAAVGGVHIGLVQLLDSASRLAARLMNFRTYVDLVDRRGLDDGMMTRPPVPPAPRQDSHSATDKPCPPAVTEGLVLDDVRFRYPGSQEDAVRGVSMAIPRGATFAIVGANGSGKSTLVKLICRFYRPTSGRITWDGRDIWTIPIEEYRELLTGVFQDYMGYDLSLRENVTISDIGRPVDDAAVWEEIDAVGLGSRAREMREGLDTMLSRTIYMDDVDSESNALLSGGQWQRLAVARSRYRGARDIQLYDEPTANLDPMAEWEITQLLDQRHPRAVAICISHRLQTVRGAQQIVVMAAGEVVERGTHEALIRYGGAYRQMYDRQQSSFLDRRGDPCVDAPDEFHDEGHDRVPDASQVRT